MEIAIQAFQPSPLHTAPTADPRERDRRLADPRWDPWPFGLYRQTFHAGAQWLRELTQGVPGVDRHHGQVVAFAAQQLHDMFSPANSPATNPLVLQKIAATGRGWPNTPGRDAPTHGQRAAGLRAALRGAGSLRPGAMRFRRPACALIQRNAKRPHASYSVS
jgi:polyhydroxyalkanoate synthase